MVAVLVVLLLIGATAFLAFSETSLIASKHTRLEEWQAKGNKGARKALALTKRSDLLLSTIEVGVTLISIALGAYSEGGITTALYSNLKQVPALAGIHQHAVSLIVVALITYIVLLAQLVPKRLALIRPEKIASAISGPMTALANILHPAVSIVIASTNAILHLLPKAPANEPPVTESEILMLVTQATKAGVFEEVEHDMFRSILRLEDVRLSSLMTPRTEMHWLDVNADVQTILETVAHCNLWELPVAEGNADNVLGIVNIRDVMANIAQNKTINLRELLQPGLYIPDTENALFMLQTFRRKGHFIAVLLDEFGGVTGIVSIRDVVEAIVGDIASDTGEHIHSSPTPGVFVVDGLTPVEEFINKFEIGEVQPQSLDYDTVAGLVIDQIGHLPSAGEETDWHGLRLKVLSLDGHRVDKLKVTKAA